MPNQPTDGSAPPKRLKARPEGLMPAKELYALCASFVKRAIPESNIVLEQDFDKFMPLFNAKLKERLSEDEWVELSAEYSSRFSLQHCIQVLSNTLDEKGVLYPKDHRHHRLVRTIPPFFNRVKTLNEFSDKAPVLISKLFNAVSTSAGNPLDHRESKYAATIGKIIQVNDQHDAAKKAKMAELKEAESKLVQKKGAEEKKEETAQEQEDESSLSGLIDWG